MKDVEYKSLNELIEAGIGTGGRVEKFQIVKNIIYYMPHQEEYPILRLYIPRFISMTPPCKFKFL